MSRLDDAFLWWVATPIAIAWVVFATWAVSSAHQPPGPEHIYDTPFGSVACASKRCSACGCDLFNCHDGATYSCLQNIRKRER